MLYLTFGRRIHFLLIISIPDRPMYNHIPSVDCLTSGTMSASKTFAKVVFPMMKLPAKYTRFQKHL